LAAFIASAPSNAFVSLSSLKALALDSAGVSGTFPFLRALLALAFSLLPGPQTT